MPFFFGRGVAVFARFVALRVAIVAARMVDVPELGAPARATQHQTRERNNNER
jgi:hypothetical protein